MVKSFSPITNYILSIFITYNGCSACDNLIIYISLEPICMFRERACYHNIILVSNCMCDNVQGITPNLDWINQLKMQHHSLVQNYCSTSSRSVWPKAKGKWWAIHNFAYSDNIGFLLKTFNIQHFYLLF
jgi:hypothetical protein